MKLFALEILRCPACRDSLKATIELKKGDEVIAGRLACPACGGSFPVVKGVPRFVNSDGYADAFSFEWNVHRTTQLDSATGKTDSIDRFARSLGFPLAELEQLLGS